MRRLPDSRVSAASPFLEDALVRWELRGTSLQKEIRFQKELLQPLTLAVHGNRLALRERRRGDLREMIRNFEETQARWNERLERIQGWKTSVTQLQQEEQHLRGLIGSSVWLEKVRRLQDRFLSRFVQRAERLDEQQQAFQSTLDAWRAVLEERATTLEDLAQKQELSLQQIYVSRARKQPELDFIREQDAMDEALGSGLKLMRSSLRMHMDRLQKAFGVVEQQASGSEIFYELHKQEVLSGLKSTYQALEERRQRILEDALLYESCRHLLKRLKEFIRGLQCLEDIPQQKSGWKWSI